jgi:hypothetical protein
MAGSAMTTRARATKADVNRAVMSVADAVRAATGQTPPIESVEIWPDGRIKVSLASDKPVIAQPREIVL